jgi:hypothetical protein
MPFCPYGYLIIKRAGVFDGMFITGEPIIDDIAMVLQGEGEEVPDDYESVKSMDVTQNDKKSSSESPYVRPFSPPFIITTDNLSRDNDREHDFTFFVVGLCVFLRHSSSEGYGHHRLAL